MSDRQLQLAIPASPDISYSRLNARNAPGARPYCNHQPLKKISWIERNCENLTPRTFFTQIIFNMKISRSTLQFLKELYPKNQTVYLSSGPMPEPQWISDVQKTHVCIVLALHSEELSKDFLSQKLNPQTKLLPTYCKFVSAVLPLEPQIMTVGGLSDEEERWL